ncbi:hypothetical protein BJV78DRAFT_1156913 [Lactifluus subvellereus]|nr:hypothetical protein BJV78DRAFT_1156913 [Lactifluus subvellereus]
MAIWISELAVEMELLKHGATGSGSVPDSAKSLSTRDALISKAAGAARAPARRFQILLKVRGMCDRFLLSPMGDGRSCRDNLSLINTPTRTACDVQYGEVAVMRRGEREREGHPSPIPLASTVGRSTSCGTLTVPSSWVLGTRPPPSHHVIDWAAKSATIPLSNEEEGYLSGLRN